MHCPSFVERVLRRLREGGHQAVVVGGAVRDGHLGLEPHDWDLSTDARPERVVELFDRVVTVGLEKGTVLVLMEEHGVEVTSFRRPGRSAFATPGDELFGESLEADLSARDFTLDAMAWSLDQGLIDPHGGRRDLADGILRAVGSAEDRFAEDPLRVWRGCRLAATYALQADAETARAMKVWAPRLSEIPGERIRDELLKLLAIEDPRPGFELARELGVLEVFLPELVACHDVQQNPRYHRHDVWGHTMSAIVAADAGDDFLRLAALFHDLGKPVVAQDGHFHGHEGVGAEMVPILGRRLHLGKALTRRLAHVVAQHMFHYSSDMSDAALRRFIRRVGTDEVETVLALRRVDRAGKGWSDEGDRVEDLELRARLDGLMSQDCAFGIGDLAIGGKELMDELSLPEGPQVGRLLHGLLEWVLDDPERNEASTLLAEARRRIHQG